MWFPAHLRTLIPQVVPFYSDSECRLLVGLRTVKTPLVSVQEFSTLVSFSNIIIMFVLILVVCLQFSA